VFRQISFVEEKFSPCRSAFQNQSSRYRRRLSLGEAEEKGHGFEEIAVEVKPSSEKIADPVSIEEPADEVRSKGARSGQGCRGRVRQRPLGAIGEVSERAKRRGKFYLMKNYEK
jgi:hypothetical protein